jgi:glycerol-3-phosphate responsive antiterminator
MIKTGSHNWMLRIKLWTGIQRKEVVISFLKGTQSPQSIMNREKREAELVIL